MTVLALADPENARGEARDRWAGAAVLDGPWAHERLDGGPGALEGLLRAARSEGVLLEICQDAPWRDASTLDAFRLGWVGLQAGAPLPPESGPAKDALEEPLGGPDLVVEAGGLTLTVPRFGARRGGSWTLLEDGVVMPGARVAPGARLARAIVAPGAVVPGGLVVCEDSEEDARWFRVTPGGSQGGGPRSGGTALVTAPMLARRTAERMRGHATAAFQSHPFRALPGRPSASREVPPTALLGAAPEPAPGPSQRASGLAALESE